MKKYALLLLIALTLSTAAWANPIACVQVNPTCPTCADDVYITVLACIPKECSVECTNYRVCENNMILVDVYLRCAHCSRGGSTKVNETVNVGDLCPGSYMVLATVHCPNGGGGSKPETCAVGATVFNVICANCPRP